jgi:hypothetical protein
MEIAALTGKIALYALQELKAKSEPFLEFQNHPPYNSKRIGK